MVGWFRVTDAPVAAQTALWFSSDALYVPPLSVLVPLKSLTAVPRPQLAFEALTSASTVEEVLGA